MRALVVYESMYGNTALVAERIRDGLAESWEVDLRSVDDETPLDLSRYALVVIGGPTHAFGMSTAQSRQEALKRVGEAGATRQGIREWIPRLGTDFTGDVAVFDTRAGRWGLAGSAARKASRRLRREGYRPMALRSFAVSGTTGPMREGELYLARSWGSELAVRARSAGQAPRTRH